MDCTIRVAKTKALISFAVTGKLICVFVFAYAKRWFSHDAAQLIHGIPYPMIVLTVIQSTSSSLLSTMLGRTTPRSSAVYNFKYLHTPATKF